MTPILMAALALSAPLGLAASDVYTLDAHIVDAGSSTAIGNSCSRLQASIGEPVAGYSAGSGFSLLAGFQGIAAVGVADTLFFDGFQGCIR